MKITKINSGQEFDIFAVVEKKSCPVIDYISSCSDKKRKQIFALLNLILDKGPPRDDRKFRGLGDGIYELKTRSGARILCFYGGNILPKSIILTHGFPKPKRKILQRQKEKAIELSKQTFEIVDIEINK